jgi:lycopene cyclase domain-containing protein
MTYFAITLPAVLLAILLAIIFRRRLGLRVTFWTLAVMVLLTAVFDNLIIAAGLVAYDSTQIHGFKIGLAPIEDFAYTIFAVVVVPLLWRLMERKK